MARMASEDPCAVDTSALIAIHLEEPGCEFLVGRIMSASVAIIGAPQVLEASMVLTGRLGPRAHLILRDSMRRLRIQVVPFTEEHSHAAVEAFLRFGRGRHQAALNFGDCIAYATAELSGFPLLYKGDDFAQTDIPRA